jgi:prepilin-type N-terminal cleavage/methylation domain-containing protein
LTANRPRRAGLTVGYIAAAQRGFALLELAIAVALATLLAVWAADRLSRDVEDAAQRATGRWLSEIRRALDSMLARHGDLLAAGQVARTDDGRPVYADAWSPTIAELKRDGHLPQAFPPAGPVGVEARVRVARSGACPGAACRLDALAYISAPLVHAGSGKPDFSRIAGVLMATEGAGASVSELAPGRLRGGSLDLPNPPLPGMAALPPGTVAVWAGREAGARTAYLRPHDSRNPDFRGDVSAAGTVAASGRLVAGEHLKLGAVASAQDPCPENGLLARDAAGGLLSCVAGVWSAPGGFGGAFSWNTGSGCTERQGASSLNPRTGRCSCPPGFKAVLVAAGGVGDWLAQGWTEGYVCVR